MFAFTEENERKFEEIVSRFPAENRMAATLPTLWLAQEQHGWLPPEVLAYVAKRVGVTPAHVLGVATFYTMYLTEKPGEHLLEVCTSVSCCLTGGRETLKLLCDKLEVLPGETTKDGKFTVRAAECLGSCDTSPMMQVDNDVYVENLTPEKLDALIDELKDQPWGTRTKLASFCAAGNRRS
ncbi:NADH-quinone oxidoreductase subunit 2 [compost metagenome]